MFDTMNSPNRNIAIVRAVRDQGGTPTNVSTTTRDTYCQSPWPPHSQAPPSPPNSPI